MAAGHPWHPAGRRFDNILKPAKASAAIFRTWHHESVPSSQGERGRAKGGGVRPNTANQQMRSGGNHLSPGRTEGLDLHDNRLATPQHRSRFQKLDWTSWFMLPPTGETGSTHSSSIYFTC